MIRNLSEYDHNHIGLNLSKKNINSQKIKFTQDLNSKKSICKDKRFKTKEYLKTQIKGENNNNTKRNYSTRDLILYIENKNSNNKCNNNLNNSNNSYNKMNGKNKQFNNIKNKYLDNHPLKLEINTESNIFNKNKGNRNLELLIDIMNSNGDEFMNKNNYNNKENKRINQMDTDKKLKYSNTEIFNYSDMNTNLFLKTTAKKNDKKGDSYKNKNILNKYNKNNGNKLIINCLNSNFFNNSSNLYNNIKTSSNSINNYFKIKNMNLHFLNEVHHSPTEINVLTSYNIGNTSKKLTKNISGDSLLKQKIKTDLDQIKKNKELSQQLEITSKELDKMQNIRTKYLTSLNNNINMKKEYTNIKKKYENYSKDIESKENEINEKNVLIDKLSNEINLKNNLIKDNKDALMKKDEIINILNNKIKILKGKNVQLTNENNILYKFKELYDENASKNIKLENNINKFMDINNKYISLQQNYNILENNYNNLLDIKAKYENLNHLFSILRKLIYINKNI